MGKTATKKQKKTGTKTTRNYKNGRGPKCGDCGRVGHYRVTCPES